MIRSSVAVNLVKTGNHSNNITVCINVIRVENSDIIECNYVPLLYYICIYILFTVSIHIGEVLVTISPFDDDVKPVFLTLEDDKEIEPMDIYQLMVVNFSDPRVVVGDVDTTYIIIIDDDGKLSKNNHNM